MTCTNSYRLDFWPVDRKAVAIAPTFEEDLVFNIAEAMTVVLREANGNPFLSQISTLIESRIDAPTVRFRVRFGAVHVGDGDYFGEPGRMIFLCAVAQTKEEFLYYTRKV